MVHLKNEMEMEMEMEAIAILNRLSQNGVTITLSDDKQELIANTDEAITNNLSDEVWDNLCDLKDDNEAKILAYLQNYNSVVIDKLKATMELWQMLMGQDVQLFNAKVISVSELAITLNSDGALWQIERDTPHDFTVGDFYNVNAKVTGFYGEIMDSIYVKLEASKITYIKSEVF